MGTWLGGLKIQNNKNDAGYIAAFFPAFLQGSDIFQIVIVFAVILVLIWIIFTFYRRKKSSQKVNRRISSLRREFNNVKEKSEYDWIEDRLNDEDHDLDGMNLKNKR